MLVADKQCLLLGEAASGGSQTTWSPETGQRVVSRGYKQAMGPSQCCPTHSADETPCEPLSVPLPGLQRYTLALLREGASLGRPYTALRTVCSGPAWPGLGPGLMGYIEG